METAPPSPARAVVLLSGGLDSATTLALARTEGYECHALTFNYGQRHSAELAAARAVARALGAASHRIIPLDLSSVGGSSLTEDRPVPKHRSADAIGRGIPSTYVPARNTIFLAFALAWCEVLEAPHVFLGVNALDYSGYPDCRPEYIAAFEHLATLATRMGVEGAHIQIHAPLLALGKAEIIRRGLDLGVDFSLTHTCYDPASEGSPCGACDACHLRRRGFAEAGVPDPLRYQETRA
jgi:7-cyano-7-deazaguanine synthase